MDFTTKSSYLASCEIRMWNGFLRDKDASDEQRKTAELRKAEGIQQRTRDKAMPSKGLRPGPFYAGRSTG